MKFIYFTHNKENGFKANVFNIKLTFRFCLVLVLLLVLISPNVFAQKKFSSLLVELDKTISNDKIYVQKKENRIKMYKDSLNRMHPDLLSKYRLNTEIFKEYKPYKCDSAILYLHKNIQIATELNDSERKTETLIKLAYLMGSTGMYKEGIDFLESIDKSALKGNLIYDYYSASDRIYGELAYYTQDKINSNKYKNISNNCKDSLNKYLPRDNDLRLILKETYFRDKGEYVQAIKINDLRLAKATIWSREYALITFHRALSYREMKDTANEEYYLALSALSDIKCANKDHASLFILADILYNQGDIERAYKYIRFSWNETLYYNARLRTIQSASILSLIDKTYQAKIERQNRKLQIYISLAVLLTALLIIIAFWLYRQMKRSRELQTELKTVNTQLEAINIELTHLNSQLTDTNTNLSEANIIKEEYIGRFIKLCSTYIDKLDNYRHKVNRKILSGNIQDALAFTKSQDILDQEFNELYINFDTAFLRIFPDFVTKVNELLREEEQITLKRDELLNTELRIMALIRLGINDSQQIADFLRYSVNTIYNYRAKIKNKAIVTKNDFEGLLMFIK